MDHATRVSIQLLNVNAHTITRSKFRSFKETQGLMNKPGLSFASKVWPWALLDLGPGLELRSRTAAPCRHLRLLLSTRVYVYWRKDLHKDANARFTQGFLV
jgi:hypothetical protein